MARRVFRILLILVLASLTGVAGWQVWSLDRTRTQQREAAALLQRDALRVTQAILDLRASQRAYLSPGQGIASWKPRVDAHINTLRDHFHALREQASASSSPYAAAAAQADDEAMDALVALKYLEIRVADHVTEGRIQHAADLVYADGVRISLTLERAANAAFTAHAQDLEAGRQRVQWTEGGLVALAVAIGFVLAWLVMPARRTGEAADDAARAADATGAGGPAGVGAAVGAGATAHAAGKGGRHSDAATPAMGLGLSSGRAAAPASASAAGGGSAPGGATKSGGVTAMPGAATAAGRGVSTSAKGGGGRVAPAAAANNAMDDLPLHGPATTYASASGSAAQGRPTATSPGTSSAAVAVAPHVDTAAGMAGPAVPGAGESSSSSASGRAAAGSTMAVHTQEGLLAAAAELTVAVARAGDVDGLRPVLARLAEYLDAVGVIVWLEDATTQRLTPIVTHGYPPETLAHLPPIELDADNATARAWRLAELQIVASRGSQPGAIVVPMPSSAGCVGVVSAEVRHGREHDPATLALARILAAQLAMLTGARG